MLKTGIIVKNISNSYFVNADDKEYTCTPRGLFRHEKIIPLVGDNVDIETEGNVITKIHERTSISQRPAVANINYALLITSVKAPDISLSLLDRMIAILESKKIKPIIIFTKLDLLKPNEKKAIKSIMKYYKSIGYKVFTNNNTVRLKIYMKDKLAFLIGQTGAGKSTLLNKLNKNLNIETKPISKALGRGVHTTRHTELYKINNFYVADTPGFSSIDLNDINKEDLKKYFIEFKEIDCKFSDCNHDKEECNVKKYVESGKIKKERYENYLKFYKELNESSSKLYK